MQSKLTEAEVLPRDGTSQAARGLDALDPGYVSVDERTVEDFVAFARAYGAGLTYHDANDQPAGDFADFVGSLDPRDVAAFMKDPAQFSPASSPALFRPHFVLFLAFLELFQKAQAELNTLTGRHLDFHYRQVLGLAKKGPVPDRLNLIFDLAKGASEVLVPAGSRLSAGPDRLKRERIYATDRDLIANRIQIDKLRSLFIERRFIGFREARSQKPYSAEAAALALFGLALGDPLPGDPLPLYSANGVMSFAQMTDLDALTQFTKEDKGFYLSLDELRDLMHREEVAEKLEAAREAAKSAGDDATEQLLATQLEGQWAEINAILETAGQRRDPTFHLPAAGTPGFDPTAFSTNAAIATGTVNPPSVGHLEDYWQAIQHLEAYFFMSAESFHDVMKQIVTPTEEDWARVEAILGDAHNEKLRDGRRRRLKAIAVDSATANDLAPLIHEVMGDASATVDDVVPFLAKESDLNVLQAQVPDWDRILSILEVAESNRLGEAVVQREEWLNLYPAEDAALGGARKTLDAQQGSPQWATFGLPPAADPQVPPAPVLGWALSAPLLSLSEGTRIIDLILGFRLDADSLPILIESLSPATQNGPPPLRFEISTKKGWVECPFSIDAFASYQQLSGTTLPNDPMGVQFRLTLAPSTDPIVALPAAFAEIDSPWPVLRVMLRPAYQEASGRYVARYRELGALSLVAVQVRVAVSGLQALTLQNDTAILNAKKPFEPFGGAPAVGSRLLLGHPEVVTKQLDSLTFNVQWMGAPPNLANHYLNYGLGAAPAFTAKVSLVDRSLATELTPSAPLFAGVSPTLMTNSIGLSGAALRAATAVSADITTGGVFDKDPSTWRRYFQWELNSPDFQHETYPVLASSKALAMASDIVNKKATIVPADYQVNAPYTPKLKSLTLDYSASLEVRLDKPLGEASPLRIFHVHPFGYCDIEAERSPAGLPFLPRYDNDGELYLGLKNVSPPQSVSILFQLAEGSANPDLTPQPIQWSYLSDDRWIPLDHRVLVDTTRGLSNSGIVELGLEPAGPSTRLSGGLYWVRAAVARDTASICDSIALHTQATSATFVDHDNDREHFRSPLPAGTLTKLVSEIPKIARVRQPYASFGGRVAEADGGFATRVSERLRHKQRALSMWDYERLVLDRFPAVYKAKCLPASGAMPGQVALIIIPDIRNMLPFDPFEPKAPSNLLLDVEAFLASRTPAFASVKVRNARYVAVRVRLRVRFTSDGNEGFYVRKLNDELNRFLSPWAYEEGADITLGGKIYANSIVDFVDRRPYVDYVAGVKLFSSNDGENFTPAPPPPDGEGDFVDPGSSDSVLVAARTHTIDVLHDALYQEKLVTGINFMKVELDFIVA